MPAGRAAEPSSELYDTGLDGFYLGGAAAIVLSYVLEAPLRFGLNAIGLDFAIYLRDAMIVAYAGISVIAWGRSGRGAGPLAVTLAVLALHALIGFVTLNDARQPLFGLKIFLPLVLGVVIGPLLHSRTRQVERFAAGCFWITAIGVLLNAFVEYPWTGMSFETAIGTRELSRKWWSAGEARLAGFTRASYLAAQIMLASLVPLLAARPRWWLRVLLISIAVAVITLTTSKAAYIGLLALLLCSGLLFARGMTPLLVGFIALLYFSCVALPIVCVQLDAPARDVPSWAASFVERMLEMWPRAFALLDGPLSVVLGRGLGGIGSPQQLGEAYWYNTADNVMLFLLVSFGIAGPIYVGIAAARLAATLATGLLTRSLSWACSWIALLLAVGLTSQMIEDPISNLSLGVSLALLFQPAEPAYAPAYD